MARQEQDREDVLQEATALVERVELWLPDSAEPIVAGFRRDGAASFYFGSEPVFQFNASRELRRAYDQSQMFKAVGGKLQAMLRVRDEHKTTLQVRELDDAELKSFLERMLTCLKVLQNALRSNTVRIGRQVPLEAKVTDRVLRWLDQHCSHPVIADKPNVG